MRPGSQLIAQRLSVVVAAEEAAKSMLDVILPLLSGQAVMKEIGVKPPEIDTTECAAQRFFARLEITLRQLHTLQAVDSV